jgi:vacuolar-type H+-ATPase subunit I/STV1
LEIMVGVNMKSSIVAIIGGALVILGCLALVFACLLAWLVWGGSPGGWTLTVPEFARELKFDMAITVVIGLGAVVLGLRLRHVKRGVDGNRPQSG